MRRLLQLRRLAARAAGRLPRSPEAAARHEQLRLLGVLASAGPVAGFFSAARCDIQVPDVLANLRALASTLQKATPDAVDVEGLLDGLRRAVPANQSMRGDPRAAMRMIMEELSNVKQVLDEQFRDVGFADVHPLALRYLYLERCSLRTPAWKAAAQRASANVLTPDWSLDADMHKDLLEHCRIALATYESGQENIAKKLADIWHADSRWELLVCVGESVPGRPAHVIVVKHPQPGSTERGRVVLGVRGTLEIADMITDALMDGCPFEDGYAHSGVVRSARNICDAYAAPLREFEGKGYDVVVVGHSLGAATAAAVTIRLRHTYGLRYARCICIAPPACVDEHRARECTPYILSVVHDDDFIPRSQVQSLIRLHRELMEYDWVPAAKAELRELLGALPEWFKATIAPDDLVARAERAIEGIDASWRQRSRSPPGSEPDVEGPKLLHVPGFVLHLFRSDAPAGYGAARVPAMQLENLELSETMVSDHLLDGYITALQSLKAAAEERAEADVVAAQALLPEGAQRAREAVAAGVRLAQRTRAQVAAVVESRPDTS